MKNVLLEKENQINDHQNDIRILKDFFSKEFRDQDENVIYRRKICWVYSKIKSSVYLLLKIVTHIVLFYLSLFLSSNLDFLALVEMDN